MRGYDYDLKINEIEYTPKKVSASNSCNNQFQLPVGTAADGDILYLFNKENVKIAILTDPKGEKSDATFFRVLFTAEALRRDINNQVTGSRYILSEHVIEDYKYKFSKLETESSELANCSLKYNVTYRMAGVDKLCSAAEDYIEEKIQNKVDGYAYVDVDTLSIKQRTAEKMNVMMRDISLDLSYFDSLYIYLFNENGVIAVLKNYFYYYKYNYEGNKEAFEILKSELNDIREEIRQYVFIQCTKLKITDTVGYCGDYSDLEYPAARLLAYSDEIPTTLNENTVKSKIESYISEKVNENLNSFYNNYFRNLEECADNINMIETIPSMTINNDNIDSFVYDYGSHNNGKDNSNGYYKNCLTNKYIGTIFKTKYNGNYYYKRLIYDIEIKNENVCNSTIKINSLNDKSSIIFFSDDYRYGEMKRNKFDLEMKYYTCEELKGIKIGDDIKYYNEFCKDNNAIKIHPNSDCVGKFGGNSIILVCGYNDGDSGSKAKQEYSIHFIKYEGGSKFVDKIVSESITSYPIPVKRSFIIGNDFYLGDYYIGSVNGNYSYCSLYPYNSNRCLYMRPSNNSLIYNSDYCGGSNSFPFYADFEDNYVNFVSKEEEYRIMKNRTLTQLNNIFNHNSRLYLVGQSGKESGKDNNNEYFEYIVLLGDKKLSVIYSNKTEDGYDTFKLIYNLSIFC